MPDIEQIINLEDGSEVRTKLNAAITQVNTNKADILAKQPLDADLTAIAALSPSNDDVIQRKSGAWTNRTMAQVKTDLVLVKGDVGLGNVDNTSDANKPVSTATQTALDLKQDANARSTLYENIKDITTSSILDPNDRNTIYKMINTAPVTFTISDAAASFPIGGCFSIYNDTTSTDNITIGASGSASIRFANSLNGTLAVDGFAVIKKVTATKYIRIS